MKRICLTKRAYDEKYYHNTIATGDYRLVDKLEEALLRNNIPCLRGTEPDDDGFDWHTLDVCWDIDPFLTIIAIYILEENCFKQFWNWEEYVHMKIWEMAGLTKEIQNGNLYKEVYHE
jgi:hypothetical protein